MCCSPTIASSSSASRSSSCSLTYLLLTRTSLGLQIRAVMQNRNMASALGVRTDRVNMMTFAFGSGLAGMAGACLSQIGNVGPSLGQTYIVDCFMIVVLGGVGNLVGTVCASLGSVSRIRFFSRGSGAVLGKITVLAAIILVPAMAARRDFRHPQPQPRRLNAQQQSHFQTRTVVPRARRDHRHRRAAVSERLSSPKRAFSTSAISPSTFTASIFATRCSPSA